MVHVKEEPKGRVRLRENKIGKMDGMGYLLWWAAWGTRRKLLDSSRRGVSRRSMRRRGKSRRSMRMSNLYLDVILMNILRRDGRR